MLAMVRRRGPFEWSHLTCITLAVSDERQVISGYLFAGYYCGFAWSQRALHCVGGGVPKFRFLPATQGFYWGVVRSNPE